MCCTSLLCPADRPSPIFLGYTLLFNVPPAVVSIIALSNHWSNTCRHNTEVLLLVLVVFHIYMIAFASRLQKRFDRPAELSRPHARQGLCWGESSVGLFFLVAPVAFVLSIVGFAWASPGCPGSLRTAAVLSGVLMIVYLSTVGLVLLVNACISAVFGSRAPPPAQGGEYGGVSTAPLAHVVHGPAAAAGAGAAPTLPPGAAPEGGASPYDPTYPAYYVPPHASKPGGPFSNLLYPQSLGARMGFGEGGQHGLVGEGPGKPQ